MSVINIIAGAILVLSTTPHTKISIGLHVDQSYNFTFEIGDEKFEINTDIKTISEFADRYESMEWLERSAFMVNRFGVPLEYVMDLKSMGIK